MNDVRWRPMPRPASARLINAAAKSVLKPLGCIQKGRSRIWLDDQSFWVGVIEFQPSAWGRGSYLNVGACWLWYEKDYVSFDAGEYRVESFQPYESDEQFAAVAQALVERAAKEVVDLRRRFPSPSRVQDWLTREAPRTLWNHYHLAVSAGLAGDVDQSKRSFAEVKSCPDEWPWVIELKRRSAELEKFLLSDSGFKDEVMNTVVRTRALLKLSALPENARRTG
nr:hypothetical protein [uncultured Pseudoxanthomonas sp.]